MTPLAAPASLAEPEDYVASPRTVVANVVMTLNLVLLGLGTLLAVVVGLGLMAAPEEERRELLEQAAPGSEAAIWWGVTVQFLMIGLIPFLWVVFTRVSPWEGMLRYLGFTRRWGHATFVGVGLGGCSLGVVMVLLFVVSLFEGGSGDSGGDVYGFDRFLTWPLAIYVSLTAGIGEEILFRGVLYRWVGWWGQAPLFMLGHVGGGEPLQIGLTLAVGLVFGWLRKIGWSLWTLILAHAVYDFSVLSFLLILG